MTAGRWRVARRQLQVFLGARRVTPVRTPPAADLGERAPDRVPAELLGRGADRVPAELVGRGPDRVPAELAERPGDCATGRAQLDLAIGARRLAPLAAGRAGEEAERADVARLPFPGALVPVRTGRGAVAPLAACFLGTYGPLAVISLGGRGR